MQKRGQKSWNSLEGLQKIHMTYSHSPLPGSRLILTRMLTRKKKIVGAKTYKNHRMGSNDNITSARVGYPIERNVYANRSINLGN